MVVTQRLNRSGAQRRGSKGGEVTEGLNRRRDIDSGNVVQRAATKKRTAAVEERTEIFEAVVAELY